MTNHSNWTWNKIVFIAKYVNKFSRVLCNLDKCINNIANVQYWHVTLYVCITLTVDIAIFLTVTFFFPPNIGVEKGLGYTAQIEFLSLKATTLVGHGSPSLVLRPFRSTIEGRRMRHSQYEGRAGGSSGQEMKGVVWGDRKIWWRVAEWREEREGEEGGGEERRAINDALEHVTLRNASAAICRHIYYLGDTSIRPLIIILITASTQTMYSACVTVLMILSLISAIYFHEYRACKTNHLLYIWLKCWFVALKLQKDVYTFFLEKNIIRKDGDSINKLYLIIMRKTIM